MDRKLELNQKRLRARMEEISEIRKGKHDYSSSGFKIWRDSTLQCLNEVFGMGHSYKNRFALLNFGEPQYYFGGGLDNDMVRKGFEDDLQQAERILADALEELEIAPPSTELKRSGTSSIAQPQITINVSNVLSQTVAVELKQIFASLDALGLPEKERAQAELHARELEKETKGNQRWGVLAKSLDALWTLGKPVYERVALPLVLEMLKKQAGV